METMETMETIGNFVMPLPLPAGNDSLLAGYGGSQPGLEALLVPLIFGLIFGLGLLGNGLVLLVLGRVRYSSKAGGVRQSSSPTNVFILNLSVADLSFLLLCVPFQATVYSLPDWSFGDFLCRFDHYFATVSMLVSIFTLAFMSVDRYVAVVGCGRCVRSRGNALKAVCAVWTISLLLAVPVAQHQMLVSHPAAPNSSFCWEMWENRAARTGYKLTLLALGYVLPLALIIACYSKVLFHLHKKMKNISKRSERSKRKTALTILCVIWAFCLCWLPHHVITLMVEFGTFPLTDASFACRIASHCLSYGHACVNPLLYAFLSENFRRASRQVFACGKKNTEDRGGGGRGGRSRGWRWRHKKKKNDSEKEKETKKGRIVRNRMETFSSTHSTITAI